MKWSHVVRNETVPMRKVLEGAVVSIRSTHADRLMEDVNTGVEVRLKISTRKRFRILEPLGFFVKVESQHTEHVDHSGFPNQIDCLGRILGWVIRETDDTDRD